MIRRLLMTLGLTVGLLLAVVQAPAHAVDTFTDNAGVDVSAGHTELETQLFLDTDSVEYDPPNPSCIKQFSENSYFKLWTFWCFGGGNGQPRTQDLKYLQIFNKSTSKRCFSPELRRASPTNVKVDELGNPCTAGQTSLQVYPYISAHPESEKLYVRVHRFDLSTWYYHRPHYPSYGPGTTTITKYAAGTWTC